MIQTTNIVTDIREVPSSWIFEHYLNLEEKLIGQEIFIVGPFNLTERTPSFSVFSSREGMYTFKCFSSGKGGSAIEFVRELYRFKAKSEAIIKILKDYQIFLNEGGIKDDAEYKVFEKYKVTGFELRKWNTNDKRFWGRFYIGSKILEWLNVAPLEAFQMSKQEDGGTKVVSIRRDFLYGYFTRTGQLYRIYNPYNFNCKFIKVISHVMGLDQLQYKADNLMITKSLKDIAAFYELKIPNWEVIASESENSLLSKEFIDVKKKQYKRIVTLMDDDEAGHLAMQQYKDTYDLEGIKLHMRKDLSDSKETFGPEFVRERMVERLDLNYKDDSTEPF